MSDKTCVAVDPGVCRLNTKIEASYEDGVVKFEIESECPHVAKIVEMLNESELDAFEVMKMPYGENPIYVACGKALAHSACIVPCAMMKAAEVATGMGLKRTSEIKFE
ncbi:DUF6951 family protein [Candidatus Methanomassiliicoccus intestinalis]|uniref:DUF6951 family protein n=1 Tax=Candidatus Methanomassiliicoccus intestinalis TaxID=1406512 RepID=UPI0037DD2A24